jgi:hypothetical protein
MYIFIIFLTLFNGIFRYLTLINAKRANLNRTILDFKKIHIKYRFFQLFYSKSIFVVTLT